MGTSRQQDAAEAIKQAELAVEKADRSYRTGGSLDKLNDANSQLADCAQDLYRISGGRVKDHR